MPEASAAPFVMHGARAAMAAGLVHVDQQVSGIELAVEENPGLAFDLAKTLIESVCRTILTQRGVGYAATDDLPKLFREVSRTLPFLPPTASDASETRKSLAQTLSGLSTAVLGVCELRNACGFASHGSDGHKPAMEGVQALLAASTADAIVGFLHRVHVQDRTSPPSSVTEFDENADFNDYIDDSHDVVRVFKSEFRASEVLYRMEPETYRIYLAEFVPEEEEQPEAGS